MAAKAANTEPAEEHVVEMGDHEIGVVELEIERRHGQHDAGKTSEQEAGGTRGRTAWATRA